MKRKLAESQGPMQKIQMAWHMHSHSPRKKRLDMRQRKMLKKSSKKCPQVDYFHLMGGGSYLQIKKLTFLPNKIMTKQNQTAHKLHLGVLQ